MQSILLLFLAAAHFCAAQDYDPLPMRSAYIGEDQREKGRVHHFSDENLEDYKVYFVDGRAFDRVGKVLNTFLNTPSIFVIDSEESFYFIPFPQHNFIQHSSLSRIARAAGQIILVDGRILAIDLTSSHFRHPPAYLNYLKSYFSNRDISVPESAWDPGAVNREMRILNPSCDKLTAR